MTKLQLSMFNLVKSRQHLLDQDQQLTFNRLAKAVTRELTSTEIKTLNALNTFVQ